MKTIQLTIWTVGVVVKIVPELENTWKIFFSLVELVSKLYFLSRKNVLAGKPLFRWTFFYRHATVWAIAGLEHAGQTRFREGWWKGTFLQTSYGNQNVISWSVLDQFVAGERPLFSLCRTSGTRDSSLFHFECAWPWSLQECTLRVVRARIEPHVALRPNELLLMMIWKQSSAWLIAVSFLGELPKLQARYWCS